MSALENSRQPVDGLAASLMLACCMLWGFTHVVAKLTAASVSLVMQGGLRSAIAALLLWLWARLCGEKLFAADGSWWPGLGVGLLFAAEFRVLFAGLAHTGASRMSVFLYLAPCFTALGLHWTVPSERLRRVQALGVALAFSGVLLALLDGFLHARQSLFGDLCGVLAGALWASTTVLIRASRMSSIAPAKTLFYQVAISALIMPPAAILMGEPGVTRVDMWVLASLLFQGGVVTFASYLTWFWLLSRYYATRLSVFSFLTPMFGVLAGVTLLGEPISPTLGISVALVAAGIYLVNRRG